MLSIAYHVCLPVECSHMFFKSLNAYFQNENEMSLFNSLFGVVIFRKYNS